MHFNSTLSHILCIQHVFINLFIFFCLSLYVLIYSVIHVIYLFIYGSTILRPQLHPSCGSHKHIHMLKNYYRLFLYLQRNMQNNLRDFTITTTNVA